MVDPATMDPTMVGPSVVDPASVDPAVVDPSMLDPVMVDPSVLDPSILTELTGKQVFYPPDVSTLDGFVKLLWSLCRLFDVFVLLPR